MLLRLATMGALLASLCSPTHSPFAVEEYSPDSIWAVTPVTSAWRLATMWIRLMSTILATCSSVEIRLRAPPPPPSGQAQCQAPSEAGFTQQPPPSPAPMPVAGVQIPAGPPITVRMTDAVDSNVAAPRTNVSRQH